MNQPVEIFPEEAIEPLTITYEEAHSVEKSFEFAHQMRELAQQGLIELPETQTFSSKKTDFLSGGGTITTETLDDPAKDPEIDHANCKPVLCPHAAGCSIIAMFSNKIQEQNPLASQEEILQQTGEKISAFAQRQQEKYEKEHGIDTNTVSTKVSKTVPEAWTKSFTAEEIEAKKQEMTGIYVQGKKISSEPVQQSEPFQGNNLQTEHNHNETHVENSTNNNVSESQANLSEESSERFIPPHIQKMVHDKISAKKIGGHEEIKKDFPASITEKNIIFSKQSEKISDFKPNQNIQIDEKPIIDQTSSTQKKAVVIQPKNDLSNEITGVTATEKTTEAIALKQNKISIDSPNRIIPQETDLQKFEVKNTLDSQIPNVNISQVQNNPENELPNNIETKMDFKPKPMVEQPNVVEVIPPVQQNEQQVRLKKNNPPINRLQQHMPSEEMTKQVPEKQKNDLPIVQNRNDSFLDIQETNKDVLVTTEQIDQPETISRTFDIPQKIDKRIENIIEEPHDVIQVSEEQIDMHTTEQIVEIKTPNNPVMEISDDGFIELKTDIIPEIIIDEEVFITENISENIFTFENTATLEKIVQLPNNSLVQNDNFEQEVKIVENTSAKHQVQIDGESQQDKTQLKNEKKYESFSSEFNQEDLSQLDLSNKAQEEITNGIVNNEQNQISENPMESVENSPPIVEISEEMFIKLLTNIMQHNDEKIVEPLSESIPEEIEIQIEQEYSSDKEEIVAPVDNITETIDELSVKEHMEEETTQIDETGNVFSHTIIFEPLKIEIPKENSLQEFIATILPRREVKPEMIITRPIEQNNVSNSDENILLEKESKTIKNSSEFVMYFITEKEIISFIKVIEDISAILDFIHNVNDGNKTYEDFNFDEIEVAPEELKNDTFGQYDDTVIMTIFPIIQFLLWIQHMQFFLPPTASHLELVSKSFNIN